MEDHIGYYLVDPDSYDFSFLYKPNAYKISRNQTKDSTIVKFQLGSKDIIRDSNTNEILSNYYRYITSSGDVICSSSGNSELKNQSTFYLKPEDYINDKYICQEVIYLKKVKISSSGDIAYTTSVLKGTLKRILPNLVEFITEEEKLIKSPFDQTVFVVELK
jgi:hypothetical protein